MEIDQNYLDEILLVAGLSALGSWLFFFLQENFEEYSKIAMYWLVFTSNVAFFLYGVVASVVGEPFEAVVFLHMAFAVSWGIGHVLIVLGSEPR